MLRYLKIGAGVAGVFALAAILGPNLVDMHNNLALAGAAAAYIAAAVLAVEVVRMIRRR
ncbi:MAG: hypothetical protein AB1429_17710 [Pseudomonadota bacterium]|jgi:hypothetical protein